MLQARKKIAGNMRGDFDVPHRKFSEYVMSLASIMGLKIRRQVQGEAKNIGRHMHGDFKGLDRKNTRDKPSQI